MKQKVLSMLALLLMTATGAWADDIEVDGGSSTISSDVSSGYFYMYEGTLTIEKGATVTLSSYFYFAEGSKIYLHGTLQGGVGGGGWNDGCVIHIYLNDGAKYTLSGFTAPSDACQIYYGYDAATDGLGTVSVKNGSDEEVTSSSTGHKSTTYTFMATPNSGCRFKNWTKGPGGEVLGTEPSIDVTCEQNGQYQVYANFEFDITANEGASGEYWTTYYNDAMSLTADANTTVFQAALAGNQLTMTEVAGKEIPAGKAVILKSTAATITLTPAATTATLEGNQLQGTATAITNPGNAYVLNKGTKGVGFYKLSATGTIGANKAYLTYSATARDFFGFGETTGIETIEQLDNSQSVNCYDLSGRKIVTSSNGNMPKGLYIVNGKKVINK